MDYKILQFKDIRKVNYAFMDYEFAQEHGFDVNDYEVLYQGELPGSIRNNKDIFTCLETLFTVFNTKRPEDFHGHSMSVSDLVELDGELYYVDFVGFQRVHA